MTQTDGNLQNRAAGKSDSNEPENRKSDIPPRTRRKSSIYDRFEALRTNVVMAFDLNLLKDRWFIVYCISCGLSICSRLLSGLYLVRYSQYVGLTDEEAAIKLTTCELVAFVVMPMVAIVTSVKKETSQNSVENIMMFTIFTDFSLFIGRRKEPQAIQSLRRIVSSIKTSFLLGFFQVMMCVVIATSTALETNYQMTIYAALLGVCYGKDFRRRSLYIILRGKYFMA